MSEHFKILRPWIPVEKLDLFWLSGNPAAIYLISKALEQNPDTDEIDWDLLSFNPAAIHLLEQKQNKINWSHLSINPNANVVNATYVLGALLAVYAITRWII